MPKSFEDYLCLSDAAAIIGKELEGWQETGGEEPSNQEGDAEAQDRATIARDRLLRWLVGGRLRAFGQDDEGAYAELDRQRLSKPYFDIDVSRSLFRWAPDEWGVIFVSRTDLLGRIEALRPAKARKTVIFDWREITSAAWKLAIDNPELRKASRLIAAVQDQYAMKHDIEPGTKELRVMVNDIIDHLGDRVLSRDVSALQTSSDPPADPL